jgi:hypothetical protein
MESHKSEIKRRYFTKDIVQIKIQGKVEVSTLHFHFLGDTIRNFNTPLDTGAAHIAAQVKGSPINFYSTYLFLYFHCFIMLNTVNGKGSICQ